MVRKAARLVFQEKSICSSTGAYMAVSSSIQNGSTLGNRHSRGIYVSELCNIVGSMLESYGDRRTLNILSSYYNTVVRWTYIISPQVNIIHPGAPVQ